MTHKSLDLALSLPGVSPSAFTSPVPNLKPEFIDLGGILSPLLNVALFVAVFLSFYYLIWGAFAYMLAQGKKEDLAKARARISWALIGLLIIFLAYSIARFVSEIFTPGKGGLPF